MNFHIDYEQALSLRGMVYLKNITMIDFSINEEFINTLRFLWLIVSHTYPFWLVDQWTRPCLSECPWWSRTCSRPRGGGMEVVGQHPPPGRPLVRPTWSARQPCFPRSWPRPLSVAEGQGVRLALECIAVATHAVAGSSAWSKWLWCPKYPQCYSFLPAGDGPPERGKYIVIIDKAAQSSTLSFKKATQSHIVCRECLLLFNFHHFHPYSQ